jgi:hypothetical protein
LDEYDLHSFGIIVDKIAELYESRKEEKVFKTEDTELLVDYMSSISQILTIYYTTHELAEYFGELSERLLDNIKLIEETGELYFNLIAGMLDEIIEWRRRLLNRNKLYKDCVNEPLINSIKSVLDNL